MENLENRGIEKQFAQAAEIPAKGGNIDDSNQVAPVGGHLDDLKDRSIRPFTDKLGVDGKTRVGGEGITEP